MSDQIFESSTPGIETITIAASGEYQIIADGAEGGSETGNGNPGGAGAAVIGDIYLQAGTKLEIVIGGEGGNGDGMVGAGVGAGGGGGSFVFEPSGTGSIGTLLAVAGGGGGQDPMAPAAAGRPVPRAQMAATAATAARTARQAAAAASAVVAAATPVAPLPAMVVPPGNPMGPALPAG